MEVFIQDMDKPALFVPQLKRPIQAGGLALKGDAHFASFSYTPLNKAQVRNVAQPLAPAAVGTIHQWQVSAPFPEKNLEQVLQLSDAQKKGMIWKTLQAESSGTTNLAGGMQATEKDNTIFAKVVITAKKAQVKKLKFGFSDRVRVYFNDQILYSGHDEFRSRDYRFLGTIGYFDEVYLPLKPGKNELWMAVSEDFGGWGVKAQLEEPEGLEVQ
jgi:hypothetical protein